MSDQKPETTDIKKKANRRSSPRFQPNTFAYPKALTGFRLIKRDGEWQAAIVYEQSNWNRVRRAMKTGVEPKLVDDGYNPLGDYIEIDGNENFRLKMGELPSSAFKSLGIDIAMTESKIYPDSPYLIIDTRKFKPKAKEPLKDAGLVFRYRVPIPTVEGWLTTLQSLDWWAIKGALIVEGDQIVQYPYEETLYRQRDYIGADHVLFNSQPFNHSMFYDIPSIQESIIADLKARVAVKKKGTVIPIVK